MTGYETLKNSPMPPGRCCNCEYVKPVCATGQWGFYGCYHEPYHGKWVAEIKDCPKEILSCDTCKWHGKECGDSLAYEGKKGYVVGDDWCEFYQDDRGDAE